MLTVLCQGSSHLAEVTRQQRVVEGRPRPGEEPLLRDVVAEQPVHAGHRVADRHRPRGVAVVAAANGEEQVALRLAATLPVLQRHLDGDLDRDAAGVGEEDAVQLRRCQRDEQLGQRHGRLMGEPAEHHVAEPVHLVVHRRVEDRVPVAVDGGPPRRHAVDQLPPVLQHQSRAVCVDDRPQR